MNRAKLAQQPAYRTSVCRLIAVCLLAAYQLLAATGCTQTEVEEGRGVDGEEMEVQINLSVLPENAPRTRSLTFTTKGCTETDSLPATVGAATPITRAEGLSEVEETTLENLCVVQYDSIGTQLGYPLYYPTLTGKTEDGTITLRIVLQKSGGTNKLYFLANAGDQTKTIYGKNEADFKKMTQTAVFSETGMPLNNRCIMVGSWKGLTMDESKSVVLTRAVAKIKFSYLVESGPNAFSFTPTSLKLCNVPQNMQYALLEGQPENALYTNYTALDLGSAASYCWYLPENQAGTAEGEGIAASEKEKTGVGVTDATYIELTGDAVQGNDRYPGVVFKLYPGSADYNDYNVNRNTSYAINITLTGINFADKRVTVGEIPMANPDTLGTWDGASTLFRIIVQPDQEGSFELPDWLSAAIGETNFEAGSEVSYNNPVDVTFSTMSINSSSNPRNFMFRIDESEITVTQEGLVFLPSLTRLPLPTSGSPTKLTVNVSDGIGWTLAYTSGVTVIGHDIVEGVGTKDVTFNAAKNEGEARVAYFKLSTVDCNPARQFDITVRQDPVVPVGSHYRGIQLAPNTATKYSYTWEEAKRICDDLSADGFEKGSWHLPTVLEFNDIFAGYAPPRSYTGKYAISTYAYWTSSEAPLVNFVEQARACNPAGIGYTYPRTSKQYVRCVRTMN